MVYENLESVNARIRNMTKYGSTQVIVQSRCYGLIWSNASKVWYVTYYAYNKGDKTTIDANELIVKQTKKTIQSWIDNNELEILPLYHNSFEALSGKHERKQFKPNFKLGSKEERDFFLKNSK